MLKDKKPLNKVILKIVLFILLATLLVINVKQQGYTGVVLYLNYAFAVASVFMALFELFACLTKKQEIKNIGIIYLMFYILKRLDGRK